jgi:hypothetical protein
MRRASKLATALLLAAVATAGSAFAADTARADHHLIRSSANSGCLRTDGFGTVSLLPCRDADRSQHWQSWNGGWIRNVATGFCLHSYFPNGNPDVRATPQCNPNTASQWWTHWVQSAGWGTIGQIPPDFLDRMCLSPIGWHSSEVNLRRCSPLDSFYFWKKFPLPH